MSPRLLVRLSTCCCSEMSLWILVAGEEEEGELSSVEETHTAGLHESMDMDMDYIT